MKPIEPHQGWADVVAGKEQPEYLSLPLKMNRDEGIVTSCWQLTLKERLKVLFTGLVFIDVLTFNGPIQPLRPHVDEK